MGVDVGIGKGKDTVSIGNKSERYQGGRRNGSSGFGEDNGEPLGGEKVYAADIFMLCNRVDGDLQSGFWERHLLGSMVVDHVVDVAFHEQRHWLRD